MLKSSCFPESADRRLALLRDRYHAYLASKRPARQAAPEDKEGRGQDGAKENSVAGRETRRGMRQAAEWFQRCPGPWAEFAQAWVSTPEKVCFWSDLHLGHENIIKYGQRPFGGVFHMDSSLLANAQAVVPDDAWLLFVGDLAMWKERSAVQDWMNQCPGRKLLVLGNHDVRGRERPIDLNEWQSLGFEAVADVAWLPPTATSPELWVTHYPMPAAIVPKGVLNVHGHTHSEHVKGPYINACVEMVGYVPVRLQEKLAT